MIVYYSGTGNSRYCAQAFANATGDELYNAFHSLRDGIAADLCSDRPWVFCSPTYAWQLPHLFAQYIRTGQFEGNKNVYFVMTCGDDIGAVRPQLQKLCESKGMVFRGVLEVVMPENYIAMFRVPKPETAQKIIANAESIIQEGIACVQNGTDFPAYRATFSQQLKTHIVNPFFYAFCVKPKPFYATEQCVGCGKCEQICVCKNIRMENNKPVWGNDCTHCMACICRCPQEAIEYGSKSQGKPRYVCPERK